MKNKGLHQYRFPTNPLERRIAEAWEEINTLPHQHNTIVDYLVSKDSDKGCADAKPHKENKGCTYRSDCCPICIKNKSYLMEELK